MTLAWQIEGKNSREKSNHETFIIRINGRTNESLIKYFFRRTKCHENQYVNTGSCLKIQNPFGPPSIEPIN